MLGNEFCDQSDIFYFCYRCRDKVGRGGAMARCCGMNVARFAGDDLEFGGSGR